MHANNTLLLTFGTIFLLLGFIAPLVQDEFEQPVSQYDDEIFEETGQTDITDSTAIQIISAVFFWVFGAPIWLNIIVSMIRVVFWIIVYDKIRGI